MSTSARRGGTVAVAERPPLRWIMPDPTGPLRTARAMRAFAASLLVVLGTSMQPDSCRAQTAGPAGEGPAVVLPVGQLDGGQAGPSWHHRVFTALGGAALGAGIGYFASQLSRGDWDDGPGQPQVNREMWAAVGGSVGMAMGYSFPVFGRLQPMAAPVPSGRSIITAREIQDIVAIDAYEAVRVLRPEWMIPRNTDIIGQVPQQSLPVYLDDFRLGDMDDLRGLGSERIESIRFIPAARATAMWGVGNNYGAIQVVTAGW